MLKRVSAALAALFVSLTLLSSCSASSGKQPQSDTDVVVKPKAIKNYSLLDLSDAVYPQSPWDSPVGDKLMELTGTYVDIRKLEGGADALNVLIASGDLSDLINPGQYTDILVKAGKLVDITSEAQSSSAISRRYRQSALQAQINTYGAVYTLPSGSLTYNALYPQLGFYINYDVLEYNSFPQIKTLGEYSTAIRKYLEANPKYNEQANHAFLMPDSSMFKTVAMNLISGNSSTGRVAINGSQPGELLANAYYGYEYLRFLNDMYIKKFITDDFCSYDKDTYTAMLTTGSILGVFDTHENIASAMQALEDAGIQNRTLVSVPVVLEGISEEYYRGSYGASCGAVGITTSCADPKAAFAFLDRFLYDDVQKLVNWGIEGVDYSVKDDGTVYLSEEQLASYTSEQTRASRGIGAFSALCTAETSEDDFYGQFDDYTWVDLLMNNNGYAALYDDTEKDMLTKLAKIRFTDGFSQPHIRTYDSAAIDATVNTAESEAFIQKVDALVEQYYTALVKASNHKNFDKLWKEFQTKIAALSDESTAYLSKYNAALEESRRLYGKQP